MAETTLISWVKRTWSPWTGCAKVSPACDGCYAAFLMDTRHGRAEWGGPGEGVGTRSRMSADYWKKPISWDRAAAKAGVRDSVFPSLCDPFDNHPDVAPWRAEWADVIRRTPNVDWLLLTKRVGNAEKMLRDMFPEGVPPNVWLGVTVVTQAEADRDIPKAVRTKNALGLSVLFLSLEPLIEPVDLAWPTTLWPHGPAMCCGARECGCMGQPTDAPLLYGVDWVITGGETDQGTFRARPSNPQWFRDVRDTCEQFRVAYHHKQNGEWVSVSEVEGPGAHHTFPDHRTVRRVGRVKSGRTIDGVVYDARPAA